MLPNSAQKSSLVVNSATGQAGLVRRAREGLDPRLLVVAGAACISVSAILMKTSGTSAVTAAVFRCLLALPVLVPLVLLERRRRGARPWRRQLVDLAAGALLGVDLVLWGYCIGDVGAGIATVLVNVQVVIVPLLALAVRKERLSLRFALVVPVMLLGVAFAAGAVGEPMAGSAPVRGALLGVAAGAAYAGYLFLLRGGAGESRHRTQSVCTATVGAGLAAFAIGGVGPGMDFTPGWPALGWLLALALSGQVCGWLLISAALPRLRSNVGAALLLLQPVLAVLFGVVLIGERPSAWQFAGCAVVIAAVWLTSLERRVSRSAPPPEPVAPTAATGVTGR